MFYSCTHIDVATVGVKGLTNAAMRVELLSLLFLARDSIRLSTLYAIARPSVCQMGGS